MVAASKTRAGAPSAQEIKPRHLRSSTASNRCLCREYVKMGNNITLQLMTNQ